MVVFLETPRCASLELYVFYLIFIVYSLVVKHKLSYALENRNLFNYSCFLLPLSVFSLSYANYS